MNEHDKEELTGYRALVEWLREDRVHRVLTASGSGLCASILAPGQSAHGAHIYHDTPQALVAELRSFETLVPEDASP